MTKRRLIKALTSLLTAVTAASCLLLSCTTDLSPAPDCLPADIQSVEVSVSLSRGLPTKTKEDISEEAESAIESYQILVYHDGFLWSHSWNSPTLDIPIGANRVVVFANMERLDPPATYSGLSSVKSYASSSFSGGTFCSLAMYADETVTVRPSTAAININLKRIAAKVTVHGIRNAMLLASDGDDCYLKQMFLANVAGEWTFGSSAVPGVWHNRLGREGASGDLLFTDEVAAGSYLISRAEEGYTDTHTFYPYPNPCSGTEALSSPWSPRRTVLVVSAYKKDPEEYPSASDNPEYLLYYILPLIESDRDYVIDDLVLTRWTAGEDFIVYPESLGILHWGETSDEIRIRYTDSEGRHYYRSLDEVTVTMEDTEDRAVPSHLDESAGRITFSPGNEWDGFDSNAYITVTDNESGLSATIRAFIHNPAEDIIVEKRVGSPFRRPLKVYGYRCQSSRNAFSDIIRYCPESDVEYPLEEENLTWTLPEGVTRIPNGRNAAGALRSFLDVVKTAPTGNKVITVRDASGATETVTMTILEDESRLTFPTSTVHWQANTAKTISLGHYCPRATWFNGEEWDFIDDDGLFSGDSEPIGFTEVIPAYEGSPILSTTLTGWNGTDDTHWQQYLQDGFNVYATSAAPEGQYSYSVRMVYRSMVTDSGYSGLWWDFDRTASLTCIVGNFYGLSFGRSQYSIRQDKWRDVKISYIDDTGEVSSGKAGDEWNLKLVMTGHNGELKRTYNFEKNKWEWVMMPVDWTGTVDITSSFNSVVDIPIPGTDSTVFFTIQTRYDASTDTFSFIQEEPLVAELPEATDITSYKLVATTADQTHTAEAKIVFSDMPTSSGEGDDGGEQEITY